MSFSTLPDQPVNDNETSLVKTDDTARNSLINSSSLNQVVQVGAQITEIIEQIPQYWQVFWQAYQKPVVILGWALVALILVKIAVAILIAVKGIPLLAPLLQLVGLSYSIWFLSRNFLGFAQRKRIFARLDELKAYIVGTN